MLALVAQHRPGNYPGWDASFRPGYVHLPEVAKLQYEFCFLVTVRPLLPRSRRRHPRCDAAICLCSGHRSCPALCPETIGSRSESHCTAGRRARKCLWSQSDHRWLYPECSKNIRITPEVPAARRIHGTVVVYSLKCAVGRDQENRHWSRWQPRLPPGYHVHLNQTGARRRRRLHKSGPLPSPPFPIRCTSRK